VFANVYYKDKGMLLAKKYIKNKNFTIEGELAYERMITKFRDFLRAWDMQCPNGKWEII
jgi:hypothetical protein